ncbi:MAG: PepSY domain-containing protein [Planctomycetaceae bacterium]|jgi:uncharacterized iron-regulated membrane protein|nr:PepSY domain-containing protein [Planctomycetaceae bacterium]
MLSKLLRRVCYELHLWLGIVSGLILFLVCLSGTILVFREEIMYFADSQKHKYYVDVPVAAERMSADDIIAKLESENDGMKASSITIPEAANRTITVMLTPPRGEGMRGGGERGGRGGAFGERPAGARGEGRGMRGERPQGGGERGSGERQSGEGQRGGREGTFGERSAGARGEGRGMRGERPQGGGERGSGERQGGEGQRGGRQQSGGGHGHGFGNAFFVNPYTGEVVAKGGEGGSQTLNRFFMSMMQLHRNLWINYRHESWGPRMSLGKIIVGVATIIFVIVSLTGLVLWFPRVWRWSVLKHGLTVKFRNGFWRFIYDSHNSLGFYFLIPSLILALTGLCWSFSWYRDGASKLLGDEVFKQRMQRPEKIALPEEGMKPLPVAEMIGRQKQLTPDCGDMTISIPQDRETAMLIQTGHSGFFALAVKDRTQWDRFRGEVVPVEHFGKTVATERWADKPLGAKIASAVRPLHLGDITGMSSKIVFFFACLFATSLPVTGVMLWLKKLIKRRGK